MTKLSLQAIRHVGFEDLGSFEVPLRKAGFDIGYVDVAEQDLAMLDPLGADLLVVLGGPIGVDDYEAYPVITQEIELLRARLTADRPTLGICLGAQVMAAGLGARVYQGSEEEMVGRPSNLRQPAAPTLLPRSKMCRFCIGMATRSICPTGASVSPLPPICLNQAFSRGPNTLGLQFHAELVAARFEHWLLGHASELATSGVSPAMLRRDAEFQGKRLEESGARLLTGWLARLT